MGHFTLYGKWEIVGKVSKGCNDITQKFKHKNSTLPVTE